MFQRFKKSLFIIGIIGILAALLVSLPSCGNLFGIGLKYVVNDDGNTVTITGSNNPYATFLQIPETVDGYTVTAIAPNAFKEYEMERVSLPNTIANIGEGAFRSCSNLKKVDGLEKCTLLRRIEFATFWECTNLKEIKLPENVEYIGKGAFAGCSSLQSFSIPHNVKTINFAAFSVCQSIHQIKIPASTVDIGERVFDSCFSLDTILVDEQNTCWRSADGVLYSKDMRMLHTYPMGKNDISYVVPDGVTTIMSYAFARNLSLESITIPASVIKIDKYIIADVPSQRAKTKSINYHGTIEMWNAIEKAPDWDADSPDYTIYCSDGQITKDGTVTYK